MQALFLVALMLNSFRSIIYFAPLQRGIFSKKGAYKYIPALSVIKLGLSNYTYATLKQHVLEVEKQMIVEAGQFLDDLDAEIFLQFVRLETNTSLVILVDSYVFESFC